MSPSPTRRTVMRGALWATPAVVIAAASPAFAASATSDVAVAFTSGTTTLATTPAVVTYTITVTNTPLKAGSTFSLNVGGVLNIGGSLLGTTAANPRGTLVTSSTVTGSQSAGYTLTTNVDLAPGTYTVIFNVTAEVAVSTSLTLTGVAPGGNLDVNKANDSANHGCVGHYPFGTIC